jgi:2-keto-4-pentenoate hydratase/2-oxohepta-3-ene-1,7-dioic acid hydratase in catechol pathway
MFHPVEQPMERGWVGRVDGERVIHLAAQTLQHFFSGGARAREHAEYTLADVVLLAPVLNPPAIRVFEDETSFTFANPAAIGGPGATVTPPPGADDLALHPRLAALIGAEGAIGGWTLLAEWRAPALQPPKDRDFALVLGPLVVTADELPRSLSLSVQVDGEERLGVDAGVTDWERLRAVAASGTELRTGDLLAGPSPGAVGGLRSGARVDAAVEPIGVLGATVG